MPGHALTQPPKQVNLCGTPIQPYTPLLLSPLTKIAPCAFETPPTCFWSAALTGVVVAASAASLLLWGRRRAMEENGWHRELTMPPISVTFDVRLVFLPAHALRALCLESAGLFDRPHIPLRQLRHAVAVSAAKRACGKVSVRCPRRPPPSYI